MLRIHILPTLADGFYWRCPSVPHSPGCTQGAPFEAEFGAPIPAYPPQHRYRHLLVLGTLFTLGSGNFLPCWAQHYPIHSHPL